jgi:hypothetical protein
MSLFGWRTPQQTPQQTYQETQQQAQHQAQQQARRGAKQHSPLRPQAAPLAARAALLGSLCCLPACTIHAGGTQDPALIADQLRTRVAELESQLATQQSELAELRAKLAQASAASSAELSPEELAAIPTPVSLTIDARSGLSRDGTELEVLVTPVDGRQRFVQVAGTLAVQVFAIAQQVEGTVEQAGDGEGGVAQPAEPKAPLWSRQLSPSALRDAYRSGFLGTHYLVAIPLSPELRAAHASGGLDVRVSLNLAASDRTLSTARSLHAR